jgi:alpha-N-arabinofuranosidase
MTLARLHPLRLAFTALAIAASAITLSAQNSAEGAEEHATPATARHRAAAVAAPTTVIHVATEPAHAISPLLFGQFLERFRDRPSGRENGPQAALVPDSPEFAWQPGVVEALRRLRATNLRFPGGGALETISDWTVMIDHSPFRADPRRPRGYEVGHEEYFALCRELGAEPVVAVNFRSAVWEEDTPLPPEQLAAGLVAYCNLPVGAPLPPDMPDWPALRAKNGHPDPHRVRYFQLGNEWVAWLFATNQVREKRGRPPLDDAALSARLRSRAADMLRAMRAVDPGIKLIIDAVLFRESDAAILREFLADPEIKRLADYAAVHVYRPWGVTRFTLDGETVSPDDLSANQLWLATVATPDLDADGFSTLVSRSWDLARAEGWQIAMTEWNWNGWGLERHGSTPWARGVGAAGFLHALFRRAEHIHLAHQSMMLGNDWTIAGVRVDPEGRRAPFVVPTAQVTAFYAEHAGARFTPLRLEDVPGRPQPLAMGGIRAAPRIALIDAVATESPDRLVLHFINRDPARALPVEIRLDETRRARLGDASATLHVLSAKRWDAVRSAFLSPETSGIRAETTALALAPDGEGGGRLSLSLPAGSVAALVISLAPHTP